MEKDKVRIDRLKSKETRHQEFEKIVREYSQNLYQQIRRMVTWHEDTDDILQNTFMKAWKSIDNFRGESSIETWLYRIAYNESITFLPKRNRTVPMSELESVEDYKLESDLYFDGSELQEKFQKALNSLPSKQRAVFNLKYFEEKKYEEISKILNTSIGALKASYHFAVKKIEAYFEEND
mgnify:FL=1